MSIELEFIGYYLYYNFTKLTLKNKRRRRSEKRKKEKKKEAAKYGLFNQLRNKHYLVKLALLS